MVVHINNLISKTAILAITLLLALTHVSALEWESPDSPITGDVTLNVSVDEANLEDTVSFWYNEDGDWESIEEGVSSNSIYKAKENWDSGDAGSGEYTFKANSSSGEEAEREIIIDNGEPSNEVPLSEGRINEEKVDVEISAKDELTDIVEFSVTVEEEESGDEVFSESNDCDASECSMSIDLASDLDNGKDYELEVYSEDEVGNTDTDSVDFIYDNVYEGDESPEINPEPQVFDTSLDKEEYTFGISLDAGTEDSDITVECELGSDTYDAGTQEVDEDNTEYSCDVEPWYDATADLTVRMMDEAGNSVEEDFEYTFDTRDPKVENLSTVVSIFNDDFDVNYDAYDTASEVVNVTYVLDNDVLRTENVEESDGSVNVDTEGLEPGSHEVFVWVQDEAGRWSDAGGPVEFEYRPDASPEASMTVNDSIQVTAGNFASIDIEVENTGELYIPELAVEASGGLFNGSADTEGITPGGTEEAQFTIETTEDDLGVHTVDFSSTSPDLEASTEIVIRANENLEDNISTEYETVIDDVEDLQANVSGLMQKLSDEREAELRENFSGFNESMNRAKEAYNDGEYYKVDSELEDFDSRFSSAKAGYEEIQMEHSKAQRNKMVALFFLAFFSIGGAGIGYLFFSEEYELDVEALQQFESDFSLKGYELSLEPLMVVPERIGAYTTQLLEEEEEEVEQAFTGFT